MKRLIDGNWKMNHGPSATRDFLETIRAERVPDAATLLLFPPAISFGAARRVLGDDSAVALGVQNVHWERSGALTGEISAEMAADAGAEYALVGHSERRHVFGETVEETARKVEAVWRAGLIPMLCVGETLEEREEGRLEEVVLRQLDVVLELDRIEDGQTEAPLALAYEPVWAIGTGRTATPEDASEAHGILQARLTDRLGRDRAGRIPILYGGSVNPDNATDLLAAPRVGGVLVGGASLDPASFLQIAACAG